MLLADKIVTVGIGQCGSNMVKELENLGFNAFYINSSLEDLETISTNKNNKYHIKGTKGMAKDRQLAKEVILSDNNADNIAYAIHDQYAMADIIFVFYSLSGGTGGTMGNFICETIADIFPDKTINVVAVKGKSSEDVGLQANAIRSLEHLKKLQEDGVITQIHLLDNDKRSDIFSINKDFAICLSRFVDFNEITTTGNLDGEERERVLIQSGMGVVLEFSDEDFGNGIAKASENTIYADWLKDSKLHGLILNRKQDNDINRELIKEVLGMAIYTHNSIWEEDSNVLMSAGMSFNENILIKMKKNAQEMLDKKKRIEEESRESLMDDVDFDTTSIMVEMGSKKKNTSQTSQNSRRRGSKSGSSVLDKYRNM